MALRVVVGLVVPADDVEGRRAALGAPLVGLFGAFADGFQQRFGVDLVLVLILDIADAVKREERADGSTGPGTDAGRFIQVTR
jgi:hypothetical protein